MGWVLEHEPTASPHLPSSYSKAELDMSSSLLLELRVSRCTAAQAHADSTTAGGQTECTEGCTLSSGCSLLNSFVARSRSHAFEKLYPVFKSNAGPRVRQCSWQTPPICSREYISKIARALPKSASALMSSAQIALARLAPGTSL